MNLYFDKKKKRKERREEEYKTNRMKSQDESDFLSNIEGRYDKNEYPLFLFTARNPPDPILSTRYICHNSRPRERALKNVTRFRCETRGISLWDDTYF